MLNRNFQGTLVKWGNGKVNEDVCVKLAIKHVSDYTTQNFLNSFEDSLKTENITSLFRDPIQWRKVSIDTSDWEKTNFKLQFDEVEFDARLRTINVARKTKNGDDTYEYVLEFTKEFGVENEDAVIPKAYLNYKEEDENGKKVQKLFDVFIELKE